VTARLNRADCAAELGQFGLMCGDLGLVVELQPSNALSRRQLAMGQLGRGDVAGYRQSCAEKLKRFAAAEGRADCDYAARACVLAPDAGAEPALVVKLAERALGPDCKDDRQRYLLGAALLRAGRHAEAVEQLELVLAAMQGDESASFSPAYPHFFLAIAHCRLGRMADAHKCSEEAVTHAQRELAANAATPPLWNRRLTLQLLWKEAESALASAAATTNPRDEP
jgi:tetratricopeptide (TPR) repeat protein